jgi:hypothetical protein
MTSPTSERSNSPPSAEAIARGHELRDVNIRAILFLAAAVALGAVIVHVGLWFLLRSYQAEAKAEDPQLSPLAEQHPVPRGPRLQQTPIRDFDEYRADQERQLSTYGWADDRHEHVRIPIARAIDILAERGLPKVESRPPKQDEPPQESPGGGDER